MAHGSNDGYVVDGGAIVVIIYQLNKRRKASEKFDLEALESALRALEGDGDEVVFSSGEYGGPGAWMGEITILGGPEIIEVGRWAERVASILRAHNAPRGDTVMVASFGREWGV